MSSDATSSSKGSILIVDDSLNNLNLLCNLLRKHGYRVRKAVDGQMALMGVQAEPPDLIMLDVMMPDMDGYSVCRQLKSMPETAEIPIIFLSALSETLDKIRAFEVGGADYITKPYHAQEVLARVAHQISLRSAYQQIQQLNHDLEQRVEQRTLQLELTNHQLQDEIGERQRIQDQLTYMAFHDVLTGLPNRALFMQRLQQVILKPQDDSTYAVLFLDCDRFKLVNDSLGHLAGDQLLIAVAQRLQQALDPQHLMARLGGDEFTILLDSVAKVDDAIAIAERLQQSLATPFRVEQRDIFINASIGIVLGTPSYTQPDMILRDADTAMYQAKAQGKACYQVFDPHMHDQVRQTLTIETDLRMAFEHEDFQIHYQPIVCLTTGNIAGFEALLRWTCPKHGVVSPADFIPIAEETGLIIPIGLWVMRQACQQFKQWQDQDLLSPDAIISVNLSVKQFAQRDLIQQINQILTDVGLSGRNLKLEITESAIMDNPQLATSILHQLRDRNIQLSIDDFGTGYSSLSSLHQLCVDTLKIDRSFVSRIGPAGENLEMIQAITSLAHHLKMTVTAEGIETDYQFKQLRAVGCERGQGYYWFKPLPPAEIVQILQETRSQMICSLVDPMNSDSYSDPSKRLPGSARSHLRMSQHLLKRFQ